MTVFQESVGTKADRGEVGFHPGPGRQFLVFPRPLRLFAGRTVVGIEYELLSKIAVPKSEWAPAAQPPAKKKPRQPAKIHRANSERPVKANVIAFKPPTEDYEEDEDVVELKNEVRYAMKLLEEGKVVAAFNLLKRVVGE